MKPLLAHTIEDTSKIKYPVYVSVKLDGIRCLIIDGVAVSRSLKPIKNKYIQSCIGKPQYNGLDGEIVVGGILAEDCYRVTNSGVMSSDGEPDFTYHVFDRWDRDHLGFSGRLSSLDDDANEFITVVNHELVDDEKELLAMKSFCLESSAKCSIRFNI
jgi:DNA ligase-1